MGDIERAPERVAVNCSPARTGAWLTWPVVENSEPLREFEVEYVRADIHAGAVETLAVLVRLKDGPRDDAYRAAKDAAWDAAREVVRNHAPDFNDEAQCDCGAGEHEPCHCKP
jgi:hypothetical protein